MLSTSQIIEVALKATRLCKAVLLPAGRTGAQPRDLPTLYSKVDLEVLRARLGA